MFTDNPFARLSVSIAPVFLKTYVAMMIFLVVAGTLYDMYHKQSAAYFFDNWRRAGRRAGRRIGSGSLLLLALGTATIEGLLSGEFCNVRRRIAHLLTMYGFLAYAVTTVIMVFFYAGSAGQTPAILPELWHAGAFMICLGGYWFWFFIRVDVVAEGRSRARIMRADLFVLLLLSSASLALVWSYLQSSGSLWANPILGLYLFATTALFASVPWSKFSHMFYKPAAAFQKRVEEENGWRSGLPPPADKPETFGSARRLPNHY